MNEMTPEMFNKITLNIIKKSSRIVKLKMIIGLLTAVILSTIPNPLFLLYIFPGFYALNNSIILDGLIKLKNQIIMEEGEVEI